jgi:hypothetical protein
MANNTSDDRGGGVCVQGRAVAQLQGCDVTRNMAAKGGAIYLGSEGALSLADSRVEDNTATFFGGGAVLASDNFAISQLHASVRHNKASFGNDICIAPTTLTNTNNNTVEGFVSRLGADAGLLNVTLRVTGAHNLPAEGSPVNAMLDGATVSKKHSDADGLVNMQVKLRKPPGKTLPVPYQTVSVRYPFLAYATWLGTSRIYRWTAGTQDSPLQLIRQGVVARYVTTLQAKPVAAGHHPCAQAQC